MSKDPRKYSESSADTAERIWVSRSELTRLRSSLEEAQETLDAIRNGEVDAIVVSENQIYTLAGAEHPYRVYVEQMQEGAVTVAAGGIILYCNQRFAEMVGAPLDQVIGSDITARLSAQTWETISSVINGTQSVVKCESYLSCENGDSLPVYLTANTLPLSDQTVICLVVTDLTPQKAEEKLRSAKEVAERANLAKDNFLAALSHELRTPLTPALVAISALQEDETLPPYVLADLAMVQRNIETEARLIDDLLDVTRIARGKLELQEAPLDLHVVLRRAVDVCLPSAEAKRTNVAVTLNATNTVAMGDAVRLEQVFWNVIHNAVKFTPTGGAIRVFTHDAEPQVFQVTVTDSGIGFDPADAPRIFESFEQVERTRAARFGGLGLGLSISRSIVIAHGGEIWAESPGPNLGATFHVRLPLCQPVSSSLLTTDAPSASPPVRGLRILLVEDHADTRKILQWVLKGKGHSVETAGSADEALALAGRQEFDLLISDLGLPDLSGTELMTILRDRYSLRGIAVSGYGAKKDVRQSKAAGFDCHLTKPINPTIVDQMVAQIAAKLEREQRNSTKS